MYNFSQLYEVAGFTAYFAEVVAGQIKLDKSVGIKYQIVPPSPREDAIDHGYENSTKFTDFGFCNWLTITISGSLTLKGLRNGQWIDTPLFKENYINLRDDGWAICHNFEDRVATYDTDFRSLCILPRTEEAKNHIIRYDYYKGTSFTTKKCNTSFEEANLFMIRDETLTITPYNCRQNNTFSREEETIFVTMVRYG